jgi:uncharacterized protein (DUF488 family)
MTGAALTSEAMVTRIYTIGHSNHSIGTFIDHLRHHEIATLADVRSSPRSRFAPHFNQVSLRHTLEQAGISYVFLGRELGARSDNPACYQNGKASYDLIARDQRFRQGLERLRAAAAIQRVCLMCAEMDPLECHRTMLVGIRLRSPELSLTHILADGSLETHEQSESRLLARHRLDQPELFRTEIERLAEAYQIQCDAIAYHATQ